MYRSIQNKTTCIYNQGFWIYLYFRIRHSFANVWTILNKMASFGVNHTPDTPGTLPDIAAGQCPSPARMIKMSHNNNNNESVADLSRNCKGFCTRESVYARVTEKSELRAQGTGVGPRYQAKSLACPICVFINLWRQHLPAVHV